MSPLFVWDASGPCLARISHQVATRMMKKNLILSIYADFAKVSPGQTALGARSLVRNAGKVLNHTARLKLPFLWRR